MGRTSASLKDKNSRPIPLPHDGPIYHGISAAAAAAAASSSHDDDENDSEKGKEVEGVSSTNNYELGSPSSEQQEEMAAINLLWDCLMKARPIQKEEENQQQKTKTTSPSSSPSSMLILLQQLIQATSSKQQLRALQSHRNTVLQGRQKQVKHQQLQQLQEEEEGVQSKTTTTTTTTSDTVGDDECSTTTSSAAAKVRSSSLFYRILLEWSISYETTIPLKRAIQSNLNDAIFDDDDDDDDDRSINTNNMIELRDTVIYNVVTSVIVVASLSTMNCCYWKDPLLSFNNLLTYTTTYNVIKSSPKLWVMSLNFLLQQSQEKGGRQDDNNCLDRSLQIANFVKILLLQQPFRPTSADTDTTTTTTSTTTATTTAATPPQLEIILDGIIDFLKSLLYCRYVPTESLWSVSLAYCRAVFLRQGGNNDDGSSISTIRTLLHEVESLKSTQQLPVTAACLLQGIASTVSEDSLLLPIDLADDDDDANDKDPPEVILLLNVLFQSFCDTALNAVDPNVRFAAITGLRTLVSRSMTMLVEGRCVCVIQEEEEGNNSRANNNVGGLGAIHDMAHQTLPIILHAWEYPPTRKLGNAIPSLFQDMVSLLQELEKYEKEDRNNASSKTTTSIFDDLVCRVIEQPPHRKGRYLALETLLPITGARSILQRGGGDKDSNQQQQRILYDLLSGIGDRGGHNTLAIADLWCTLINQLWSEMRIEAGLSSVATKAPTSAASHRKKDRRCCTQQLQHQTVGANEDACDSNNQSSSVDVQSELESQVFSQWLETWVPSLVDTLVSKTAGQSRRKQVAAFCLPRILTAVGGRGPSTRPLAARAYVALFQEIRNAGGSSSSSSSMLDYDSPFPNQESLQDRVLWAECFISFYAKNEDLLLISEGSKITQLHECIATTIPFERIRLALVHSSSFIRSAGFQAIESMAMASTAVSKASSSSTIVDGSQSLQREIDLWVWALPLAIKTGGKEYISTILYCLLMFLDRLSLQEAQHIMKSKQQPGDEPPLQLLFSFVVDFLLNDIFIKKASYPGTVAYKESFALSLLVCVMVFTSREHSQVFDGNKLLPKHGSIFKRKRNVLEYETIAEIKKEVVSQGVLSSVFSLLNSIWDETRLRAFTTLKSLIKYSELNSIHIPEDLTSVRLRKKLETRAIFLASSPRQREADTGARSLAVLYMSIPTGGIEERSAFLTHIVGVLEDRIILMHDKFRAVFADFSDVTLELPLAHGIIHSLRLILECGTLPPEAFTNPNGILNILTELFCRAVRLSLSVVADVHDGDAIDGLDEDLVMSTNNQVPINPGAIGANGIFSGLDTTTGHDNEHARRLASQRIVVGAWLLTKETCAALSTILSVNGFHASASTIDETGVLLLGTLTALKHAGAAFAAHRALQKIACTCFASNDIVVQQLPKKWLAKLLEDISANEKVRDSTLRRSTGYALGFLSLMRAEISSSRMKSTIPWALCHHALENILRLSLPPRSQTHHFMDSIGYSKEEGVDERSLFTFLSKDQSVKVVSDDDYETTSRVHALNILRLAIMDAPLSGVMFPFVGDAITSAIMGYNSGNWAVRNSATMVFSAAMLRVVDADKNASNTDTTSSKAITVTELFRTYPSLQSFLQSVLSGAVSGKLSTQGAQALPPVLPILILLKRVQQVSHSGSEAAPLVVPFLPFVIECLGHSHISIRKAAAQALANLSHGDDSALYSPKSLIESVIIDFTDQSRNFCRNKLHGSLLSSLHMVQMYPEVKNLVKRKLVGFLLHRIVPIVDGHLVSPPLCISTALKILAEFHDFTEIEKDIEKASMLIQMWLESGDLRLIDLAGTSELACTVGSTMCEMVCSRIWSGNLLPDDMGHQFDLLSGLFRSQCIDIRLAAVKVFKKSIYDGLDDMQSSLGSKTVPSKLLVGTLTQALVRGLRCEIGREADHNDLVGSHPPTLRRLSRCLLECFASLDAVGMLESVGVANDEIMDISSSIIGNIDSLNPTNAPYLVGNATELMAFTLRCQSPISNTDSAFALEQLIFMLSDSSLSWRLRHSSAMALYNSRVFQATAQSPDERVVCGIARMLQDSDDDTRYAISKALQPEAGTMTVPELLLQQLCKQRGEALSPATFIDNAISSILDLGQRLEDMLSLSISEAEHLEDASTSKDLLNVSNKRKIFEEEHPNSYFEPALTAQCLLVAVLELEGESQDINSVSIDSMLSHCRNALILLQARMQRAKDAIHDVTRESKVLPFLHSFVLGTAALIYSGFASGTTTWQVQQTAKGVLILANTMSCPFSNVHPFLRQALQVLAIARARDEATRSEIIRACFLISTTDNPLS